MSTVIQTKYSLTTTNVPATLADGELAVNPVDGKLWAGNGGINALIASPDTTLSVSVAAVGTANLSYNSSTGVFTYTPPDLTSYTTATSATAFTNKTGAISQWTNDSGYSTTTGTVTPSSTDTFTNKSGAISQWTNDSGYSTTVGTVTPSSTDAFTNKSGAISQWTNDSGYLTTAYTLPAATSTALGGVELFSDVVQTVAANAVTATASKTYGVQLDSSGRSVVNVPWSSTGGIALTDLSVSVAAVGTANLSYNSTTGVFSYTPPDLTSYATATSTTAFTNKSGAISQWTNDSGYLTSYTETDTLDSVTGRGATTANAITVGGFTSTGIDDNATSTAITIDSDERVGVNITPTNRTFEVKAIADAQIVASFETGSGIAGRIAIADANTTADNSVGIGSSGNNLSLYAGAAARATLSSAGNLSVTGNLTCLGIDDNATSTAISIDSAGIVSGTWSDHTAGNSSAKMKKLTQAQYDALTPDANTMYFIVG